MTHAGSAGAGRASALWRSNPTVLPPPAERLAASPRLRFVRGDIRDAAAVAAVTGVGEAEMVAMRDDTTVTRVRVRPGQPKQGRVTT